MQLVNSGASMSDEQIMVLLKGMSNNELLGQEITQKAALHVLFTLQNLGVTPANAQEMINSLNHFASMISTECKRRGLAVVDHPGGH